MHKLHQKKGRMRGPDHWRPGFKDHGPAFRFCRGSADAHHVAPVVLRLYEVMDFGQADIQGVAVEHHLKNPKMGAFLRAPPNRKWCCSSPKKKRKWCSSPEKNGGVPFWAPFKTATTRVPQKNKPLDSSLPQEYKQTHVPCRWQPVSR